MAIDVLEHVPNDVLALNEISRVIKEHGIFIVDVPLYEFTEYARVVFGHLRHYTIKKIVEILKSNNFQVVTQLYSYPLFDRIYAGVSYKYKTEYINFKNFLLLINKLLNIILKDNQSIYQRKMYHALVPLLIRLADLEKKLFKGSNLQTKHKAFLITKKFCSYEH